MMSSSSDEEVEEAMETHYSSSSSSDGARLYPKRRRGVGKKTKKPALNPINRPPRKPVEVDTKTTTSLPGNPQLKSVSSKHSAKQPKGPPPPKTAATNIRQLHHDEKDPYSSDDDHVTNANNINRSSSPDHSASSSEEEEEEEEEEEVANITRSPKSPKEIGRNSLSESDDVSDVEPESNALLTSNDAGGHSVVTNQNAKVTLSKQLSDRTLTYGDSPTISDASASAKQRGVLSRDHSLKSMTSKSSKSSNNSGNSSSKKVSQFRTPEFGSSDKKPPSSKKKQEKVKQGSPWGVEVEMTSPALSTRSSPMKNDHFIDINIDSSMTSPLTINKSIMSPTNSVAASMSSPHSTKSNSSKAATTSKRIFRRPYAKITEMGWRQNHPVRKQFIIWTDSMAWEMACLILIILNCVTLSLANPIEPNDTLEIIEMIFSIAFTIELISKIIAMGYYTDENAYMRDNWNVMDFVIVTMGWFAELMGEGGGLTALRAMRVLRPLRTIKGIPELKRIIESMIASIPDLTTVFGLCASIYLLFAILGVQIFQGKMSQRCFDLTTEEFDFDSGRFCSLSPDYGRQCEPNSECRQSDVAMNDNITSFDDIFRAFLAVFQSCTLEGWVDCMYALMDTMPSLVPCLFFVVLIWVGSLFLLNLVTVVVYVSYSQSAEDIQNLEMAVEGEEDINKTLTVLTDEGLAAAQNDARTLALRAVVDLNSIMKAEKEVDKIKEREEEEQDGDGGSGETGNENDSADENEVLVERRQLAVNLSKISSLLTTASERLQSIPNVVANNNLLTVPGGSHDGTRDGALNSQIRGATPFVAPKHEDSPGRYICYVLVTSNWFQFLLNFLIVLNTICLAVEHYDQPQSWTDFLSNSNYFFIAAFTFEIYAKLKGLGANKFREDPFNTFDSLIVFISLIEVIVGGEGGGGLAALRACRILRLFKLLRSWQTLRRILKNMAMTMNSSSSFIGLLMLVIFVFSLVGMTMFGGTVPEECEDDGEGNEVCQKSRVNYDSMFTSAVISFQIMTMENWNEVLYITVVNNGISALIFVCLNLLVGGYLMMNIFLAILIDNYTLAVMEEKEAELKKKEEEVERQRVLTILAGGDPDAPMLPTVTTTEESSDDESSSDDYERETDHGHGDSKTDYASDVSLSDDEDKVGESKELDEDQMQQAWYNDPSKHPAYKYSPLCLCKPGSTLHPIRFAFFKILLHRYFDRFILTLIVGNCITLAVNEPGENGDGPSGVLRSVIDGMDSFFTYTFIVEAALKICTLGLLLHPGSYLRNSWNRLDGLIVLTSIIELGNSGSGADDSNMGSLRALRALRALRPLRLISRLEGLQVVINTMMRAMKPCASVGAVALVFYTVFAIVGTNLFGGRFYSCTDPSRTCFSGAPNMDTLYGRDCLPEIDCVGTFFNDDSGANETRKWENPYYESTGTTFSFDNFFVAMLTLFEVASLEMWPSVMYAANDVTKVGFSPEFNATEGNSLFFVLFISIMTFFVMELFVTVIIDNFNEIKSERDGSAYMTEKQIEWVKTQKQLAATKVKQFVAPPPEHEVNRRRVFDVVTDERFEIFIMGLIIANILVMCTESRKQSEEWTDVLKGLNYFFAFAFTVEAAVKWYALGRIVYLKNNWNRFDVVIVTLTLISLCLEWGKVSMPVDPTLLRVGRICRVFRLMKSSKSVQAITQTIFLSLPSLGNVGMVLTLIFFIFAVAGMQIFGGMPKGDFITDHCNFDRFFITLVTLFRCATGESWNGLMHDAQKENSALSIFFFVFFQLVASYVMLNLFVAIILDQMSEQMDAVKEHAAHLKQFSSVWKGVKLKSVGGDVVKLAINAAHTIVGSGSENRVGENDSTMERIRRTSTIWGGQKETFKDKEKDVNFLPAYYMKQLVKDLPQPMGLHGLPDGERTNAKLMKYVRKCNIPLVDGQWVRYKDALYSIFLHAHHGSEIKNDDDDSLSNWQPLPHFNKPVNGDSRFISEIDDSGLGRNTINYRTIEGDTLSFNFTADEWFGAVVMQAWFRGSRGRIKARARKERQGMGEIGKKKKKKKKKSSARDNEGLGGGGGGGGKYNLREV